jgi:hypothetical protein
LNHVTAGNAGEAARSGSTPTHRCLVGR